MYHGISSRTHFILPYGHHKAQTMSQSGASTHYCHAWANPGRALSLYKTLHARRSRLW